MLGNFSFGDYFKKEAIEFAWNFLTKEIGLPKEKLLVTVYSEDDEVFDIWENHIGVPKEKIIALVRQITSGLWAIPIHVILVLKSFTITVRTFGDTSGTPEEDGDRFIEIWNLVFMQFNKQADGTMEPPLLSIDTGMGLERISAILQNVHSNYEIDLSKLDQISSINCWKRRFRK